MQVFTKEEYENEKADIIAHIKQGAIFIYPTDTIYGIGCDATNMDAVQKIRKIKHNYDRPFSVMVPEIDWIEEHCDINTKEQEWIEKLPGPYTLILNLKNQRLIAVNVTYNETVGIRVPHHWCSEISRLAKVPIVSTSANLSGGLFMTSLDTLHDEIKNEVDFMINVGTVKGRPSTIVHLADEVKVIER